MTAEEVRSFLFQILTTGRKQEILFQEMKSQKHGHRRNDFMELVREHSDKPEEEADLGWYRGDLMDEFELITFSMKIDEIVQFLQPNGECT